MTPGPLSPTKDPEAPDQFLFREDSEEAGMGGGVEWGRGLPARTEKPLAQQAAALQGGGRPRASSQQKHGGL